MIFLTSPGKTYSVNSVGGCTISAGGTTLATIPANIQTTFIAPDEEVIVSDDNAIIVEVTGVGAGGSGGSSEPVDLTGVALLGEANTFTAANTFTGTVDMSAAQVTPPNGWDVDGPGLTSEQVELLTTYASSEGRNISISDTGEIVTQVGHTYVITAKELPVKCTDADLNLLCEVDAHNQIGFVAPGTTAYVDDTTCTITEVFRVAAPVMLSGNGGGGEPEGDYVTMDAGGAITGGRLDTLTNGTSLQYERTTLTSWDIDLPLLTHGISMFRNCRSLTNWDIDLPALTHGQYMFYNTGLTEWTSALPLLKYGERMFPWAKFTEWTVKLPNLEDGSVMFAAVPLAVWTVDLPNLTQGYVMFEKKPMTEFHGNLDKLSKAQGMFTNSKELSIFDSALPALSDAPEMFNACILNKESALNVLTDLPTYMSGTHRITVGIHTDHQYDEEVLAAIEAATAKGWTVTTQWNGTATSGVATLDLDMIYAKSEQDENGNYVDANNARYTVDWGHMVTSPDGTPSEIGYELFYSLDEALMKWGLTEYVEPESSIETENL